MSPEDGGDIVDFPKRPRPLTRRGRAQDVEVASVALSRELHDVSGWEDPAYIYLEIDGKYSIALIDISRRFSKLVTDVIPAYDLGYLLRKLPPFVDSQAYPGQRAYLDIGLRDDGPPWYAWYACWGIPGVMSDFGLHADTPEDAACQLAIQLFKRGVLTKVGDER